MSELTEGSASPSQGDLPTAPSMFLAPAHPPLLHVGIAAPVVLCSFSLLLCRSRLLVQNTTHPKGIILLTWRPAAERWLPTLEPAPWAARRAGSGAEWAGAKSTLRCESQPLAPADSARPRPRQHPRQLALANQSLPFWNRNTTNQATGVDQEAKDGCGWETAEYTVFPQLNLSWDISGLRSILDAPSMGSASKTCLGREVRVTQGLTPL